MYRLLCPFLHSGLLAFGFITGHTSLSVKGARKGELDTVSGRHFFFRFGAGHDDTKLLLQAIFLCASALWNRFLAPVEGAHTQQKLSVGSTLQQQGARTDRGNWPPFYVHRFF